MKNRSFVLVLLTLVGGSVIVGTLLKQQREQEVTAAYASGGEAGAARPQATRRRTWRRTPERRLFTLPPEGDRLFGPLRAKVSADDHLFVADYGDFRIREYSPTGQPLRTYGNGRGQGPGELSTLNDVAVDANEVWVVDHSNGRITIFGRDDGALRRTLRLNPQPYKLALLGQRGFAMMLPPGSPDLFGLFTPAASIKKRFGHFLTNQAASSILLEGWLEPDRQGGFVFAGLHASLVAAYDGDGNPRFLVETIEPQPLPHLKRNERGVTWVDREARRSTLALSVTAGQAHLVTFFTQGLKRVGSVDTYSLVDGSYLFSRRVPESCSWVLITDRHMVTVTETTVSKWDLPA